MTDERNSLYVKAVMLTAVKEDLVDSCLNTLPFTEQERIRKYARIADRLRATTAVCLAQSMASEISGIPTDKILISRSELGKPYFIIPNKVHFNISHSGNWVICAVDSNPVGVDVEEIRNMNDSLANRFFSDDEIEALFQLGGNEKLERFYEYWTLKESYSKALGKGLLKPFNSFAIHFKPHQITTIDNGIQQNWKFKLLNIDSDYKFAVCFKSNFCVENFSIIEGNIFMEQFLKKLNKKM